METSIRSYNRRSNRTFSFFLTGFLLKHHAQAVRVSVYKGSFYYAAFLGTSKGAEDSSRFDQRKRKTVEYAGSRGTTLSGASKASQHPSSPSAGKRKANELVSSGGSTQPANRRPAPVAGCAPLPSFTSVTGEQAALGSRQHGPPRERGDVRGCIGRARRPRSAKWVDQAHSHGFGHVQTRCLIRDSQ